MTTLSDHKLSFGRHLQRCRLEQGFSLEVVAKYLRISIEVLAAIENEDYSKMPDEVFAKGFLRSFAKAVKADDDWVIEDYTAKLILFNKTLQAESELEKENRFFGQKFAISVVTMLLVIGLTILGNHKKEELVTPEPETAPSPVVANQTVATPPAVIIDKEPSISHREPAPVAAPIPAKVPVVADVYEEQLSIISTAAVPEEKSDRILLKVVAVAETWLKIIVDNQKSQEYTLKTGDQLELGAMSRFNILIGNAAGVKLFANQDLIYLPGESGQVVNIEIP